MKGKKLLTMSLSSIMLLTQISIPSSAQGTASDEQIQERYNQTSTVNASGEVPAASEYVPVDLSSAANMIGFVETGKTYTDEATQKKYTQYATENDDGTFTYESTGIELSVPNYRGTIRHNFHQHQYNKEAIDSRKVNGYLYSDDGIPFDIKTSLTENNLIQLPTYAPDGTTEINNVTLPVNGNFNEFKFIIDSVSSPMASHFKIQVRYEDSAEYEEAKWELTDTTHQVKNYHIGNVETNEFKAGIESLITFVKKKVNGIVTRDSTLVYNMTTQSDYPADYNMNLPVYKLETDPAKKVKEIYIEQIANGRSAIILAITGIAATQADIVNALVAKLPSVDEITAETYKNYIKPVSEISEMIANGAVLTDENSVIYGAVKEKLEEFTSRYVTVDLTSSANAIGFGTSDTVTTDMTNYMTVENSANNIKILNKTAFDNCKENGNIYADNGIPFKISTDENKKNILYFGGYPNSTSSITVPMPQGNYSGIAFANAGLGSHAVKNFVVKAVYTDGTSSKDTSWRQIFAPASVSTGNMGVNTSKISCFGTSAAQSDAENSALYVGRAVTYWIPVYEIDTDPTKIVKEVVFSGANVNCAYGIIGVTGIAAKEGEAADILLKRLPDAETVTQTNYMDYAGIVTGIEKCIADGAQLSDENFASYQAVKSIVDKYSSEYVTVDLTKSANAKGFGNTGVVSDITNYVSNEGDLNSIRVFNTSAFEYFKKSDENIYAEDGTPFKISTDKEKNVIYLGGYTGAPTTSTVDIPKGNYSSISFINGGISSRYSHIGIKVIYKEINPETGENYITEEKWTGISDPSTNKSNFGSPSAADIKAASSVISCFGDTLVQSDALNMAFVYKYNQTNAWGTQQYIPVYTIETDPEKTVTQVVFTGGTRVGSYSVLGLTAKGTLAVNETEVQLDSYMERIDSLTETEINEAYEILRTGVAQGETSWSKYSAIVEKKALTGLVTINAVTVENNQFSAVTNIADMDNSYSYVLALAIYDGDKLVELHKLHEADAQTISDTGVPVSYTISTDLTGKTLKCFAWDSFGTMKPVAEMLVR